MAARMGDLGDLPCDIEYLRGEVQAYRETTVCGLLLVQVPVVDNHWPLAAQCCWSHAGDLGGKCFSSVSPPLTTEASVAPQGLLTVKVATRWRVVCPKGQRHERHPQTPPDTGAGRQSTRSGGAETAGEKYAQASPNWRPHGTLTDAIKKNCRDPAILSKIVVGLARQCIVKNAKRAWLVFDTEVVLREEVKPPRHAL
ncbi:hypothetical protein L914_20823 [Phytophthora nicotianae]|uniref:Uncharacterized protein n=1 Tax=Phytophthora nicotianae TaxID=4792 RepID=W2M5P4_PHYNI|nr:hypothetical protein L914_20823 [Phytophthora nicotianae]